MSTIVIAGRWGWIWGAWHLAWLAGLVWAATLGLGFAKWYYRVLYTVWAPLEGVGWYQNRHDRDVNKARTMSEFRQFIAQQAKPGSNKVLGWRGLAGGTGILDALVMGWITWDLHPAVGVVTGLTLGAYLIPHFGWRHIFGAIALCSLLACDFDSVTITVETPECPDPMPIYDYRDAALPDTTWTPLGCPYAYVDELGDTIVVGEPIPEGLR